ncbi:MAG: hypothetical protein ACUVR4_13455, partial [Anaerolineae bacterium]
AVASRDPLRAQATTPAGEIIPLSVLFLPLIASEEAPPTPTPTPTPLTQPPHAYATVPVEPPPTDRPAEMHGDLNLALRGYVPTTGFLGLVNYGGEWDGQAPQINGMFNLSRLPSFLALYKVHDWDWSCGPDGCRGAPIERYPVTLLEMETAVNEPISIPRRNPSIYPGDFKALVLYADERRLTITYTRRDTAAVGYMVHLEDFAVHPDLLALYRQMNEAGRGYLPALRNGEIVGIADRGSVKIATRDTGSFFDPRTCKDWWIDYVDQCWFSVNAPKRTN